MAQTMHRVERRQGRKRRKKREEEEGLLFLFLPFEALHLAFIRPKVKAKRGTDGNASSCQGGAPAKWVAARPSRLAPRQSPSDTHLGLGKQAKCGEGSRAVGGGQGSSGKSL